MVAKVGEMVRAGREASGLSLRRCASDVGLPPSYLSDIENGRRLPSERALELLAAHLDLDVERLHACSGRVSSDLKRWLETNPQVRDALDSLRAADVSPGQIRKHLQPLWDGTMSLPIWAAAADFMRDLGPLASEAGIAVIQTGPFDTKGPIWMVTRPGSPDVYLWASRLQNRFEAFAGTADMPTMNVPFAAPTAFDGVAWVPTEGVIERAGVVKAMADALDWADEHVAPMHRGS